MVFAAEFTTAALVVWAMLGLGLGFVLGWLVRPWLIADRLREQYGAQLEARDAELGDLRGELAGATSSLDTTTTALESAEAEQVRLGADLASATRQVSKLEGDLETARLELEAETERGKTAASKVTVLEQRVAELEAARPSSELVSLQNQLEACREAVAARDATIAELRAATEVPAVVPVPPAPSTEAAPAPSAPAVAAPPPAPADVPPDKGTASERAAEIAARTRGDGPQVDDDLKRVHGIGPKTSALLREMGITSFRQIARFEPDDIVFVAAALDSFPDRIERDNWMASAAALHEEKYGEPA